MVWTSWLKNPKIKVQKLKSKNLEKNEVEKSKKKLVLIFVFFFNLAVDHLLPPLPEFGRMDCELWKNSQNFNSGHMACKILAQSPEPAAQAGPQPAISKIELKALILFFQTLY